MGHIDGIIPVIPVTAVVYEMNGLGPCRALCIGVQSETLLGSTVDHFDRGSRDAVIITVHDGGFDKIIYREISVTSNIESIIFK